MRSALVTLALFASTAMAEIPIPARVPHHVVLENGAFDYAVMKIVSE